MSLPTIVIPKFSVMLPSNHKQVSFRPFLVKEEKALLLALESENEDAMATAIKDVLQACVIDQDIKLETLPFFDVEYLFLNIRAKSVGEVAKFEYRHANGVNREGAECQHVTPIVVNLGDVKVQSQEDHTNKIQLTDQIGVVMKYPTLDIMRSAATDKNEFEIVAKCIECVYDAENTYEPDNVEDALKFIHQLSTDQFAKIIKFFETMPKLTHRIDYKCEKCQQEDHVIFEGVADFF